MNEQGTPSPEDPAKQIIDAFMQVIARTLVIEDILVEKELTTHAEVETRRRALLAKIGSQFDADAVLRLARFSGPVH